MQEAWAQGPPLIHHPLEEAQSACEEDAHNTGNIERRRDTIWSFCFNGVAEAFFDRLGPGPSERVQIPKGDTVDSRKVGNGAYCAHHVEDSSGRAISFFECGVPRDAPPN